MKCDKYDKCTKTDCGMCDEMTFCEECKHLPNCELAKHEEVDTCKNGESIECSTWNSLRKE